MNQEEKELGRESENNTEVGPEVHRLTISRAAEEALVSVLDRVNEGFAVGKVNRNNLANWLIIRDSQGITADDIKEIRTAHTDEFAALDMVLRRAKESGKLPAELRAYLLKQIGSEEPPKKKPKKNLQNDVINDDIQE